MGFIDPSQLDEPSSGGGFIDASALDPVDSSSTINAQNVTDAPAWEQAAGGFLSWFPGIADTADNLNILNPGGPKLWGHNPIALDYGPKPSTVINKVFDAVSGQPSVTKIGEGGSIHAGASYIPNLIFGGEGSILANMARTGAMSLGAGVGHELGGSTGELIGALAPTGLELAGTKALSSLLGPQTEEGAAKVVANTIGKYGITPDKVDAAISANTGPLAASKTSAELLQSPELATLEQVMGSGPRATEYNAANAARANASQDLLDTLSVAKKVPEEATGQVVQDAWAAAQKTEKDSIKSLYDAVPKNVTPDTSDLKQTIETAANKYFGPGSPDVPSGIQSRMDFLTQDTPLTIEGLQNARSHLGDMERTAQRAGNNQEAALAGTIKKGIADAIDNAPAGSAEWRQANEAYKNYAGRFQNGPLSKIQNALPSTVYDKILKNPESAIQAVDILQQSPQAMGAIKDQIASDLSSMTDAMKVRFINNNESQLKTLLGNDFGTLSAIRRDISSRIDTQKLANATSGSNTALKLSNTIQRAITGKDGTTNSGAWSVLLKGLGLGGGVAAVSHPAVGIPIALGALGVDALKGRSAGLIQDTLFNALMSPEKLQSVLSAKSGGSVLSPAIGVIPQAIHASTSQAGKQSQSSQEQYKKLNLSSANPASKTAKSQSGLAPILNGIRHVESSDGKNLTGPMTKWGRAKGPYGLLDMTGQEYHDKLGITEPYDPFNEKQARTIAEAILIDNLAATGDLKDAITAYHSGLSNVKRRTLGPEGRKYATSVFSHLMGA